MIWLPTIIALVLFLRCCVLEVRTRILEYRLGRLRTLAAKRLRETPFS